MKIIVGLGNPTRLYAKSHHNAGWMFLDRIAKDLGLSFKLDKEKECQIVETKIDGETLILVKPTTYMNLSGRSVKKVLSYYKASIDDLLIVYDDLDLEIGTHKVKPAGGSGGHNGMKSIIQEIGSDEFKRLRIGISRPNGDTIDYVLSKFSKEELKELDIFFAYAKDIAKDYVSMKFDSFMNKYNSI